MVYKQVRFLWGRQRLLWRQEVPVEEVDRQEKDDKFHVFAMLMTVQRYDFASKEQGARSKGPEGTREYGTRNKEG
jgi:hypothetical protein